MYLITTTDATSMTARFRMADLCWASVAEASKQERRIAGAVSHGNGAAVPAFVGSVTGVHAWSPPV
jgi:hypothetical protein